jgi:hypothetical protein
VIAHENIRKLNLFPSSVHFLVRHPLRLS